MLGGAFDLSGLLAGFSMLKAEIGARNIVFDGIDMLLSNLQDEHLERRELARLNEWVHESRISALITAKSVGSSDHDRDRLRSDIMQFMTDCVVQVDAAWTATTTSRSLRIIKYRGSGFAASCGKLAVQLEVLDVSAHVKLALSDGVIVTPTLIGCCRVQRHTIVGDLSDAPRLHLFLGSLDEA
jgi:circadian clock protein KaiC